MPLDQIDVYLLDRQGTRGSKVTIRAPLLLDVDRLLIEAQKTYPTYTYEALVKYVWVRGLDSFRNNLYRGALLDPANPPVPKVRLSRG